MTKDEIACPINPQYPAVYAPTSAPTKIVYNDDAFKVGYFEFTDKSNFLEKENKYTFIEFNNAQNYKATKEDKYVTIVDGNQLKSVIYTSHE